MRKKTSSVLLLMKFLLIWRFLHSDEKDDTLSAISGGSLKPDIVAGQQASSHAIITTPTLNASSITGHSVPTATPEVDEDEYSIKPPMDSWDKNGSPQKSELAVSFGTMSITHVGDLFQAISTQAPTAKAKMRSRGRFTWKLNRWTTEPRPSQRRSMSFERRSRICRCLLLVLYR